jgi:hypothetical protein
LIIIRRKRPGGVFLADQLEGLKVPRGHPGGERIGLSFDGHEILLLQYNLRQVGARGLQQAASGLQFCEAMLTIAEPLEVPAVHVPVVTDVVSVVDYLLSEVMSPAPAVLEAERLWPKRDDGDVVVTLRSHESAFERRALFPISALNFRTVLARLNHEYLADQLYGGCVRRTLVQAGRTMVVTIHTGNDSASGFWLRVTSSVPS